MRQNKVRLPGSRPACHSHLPLLRLSNPLQRLLWPWVSNKLPKGLRGPHQHQNLRLERFGVVRVLRRSIPRRKGHLLRGWSIFQMPLLKKHSIERLVRRHIRLVGIHRWRLLSRHQRRLLNLIALQRSLRGRLLAHRLVLIYLQVSRQGVGWLASRAAGVFRSLENGSVKSLKAHLGAETHRKARTRHNANSVHVLLYSYVDRNIFFYRHTSRILGYSYV